MSHTDRYHPLATIFFLVAAIDGVIILKMHPREISLWKSFYVK